jgi:murein DD-endopeptidase MepM/ murein hydrolase activator NlpD
MPVEDNKDLSALRWYTAAWAALGLLALLAALLVWTPLPALPSEAAARYAVLQTAPYVTGFDFPVGWPDAKGYYDARSFGMKGHMGSDWNGVGGENTDLGDPVHASGEGVVIFSGYAGEGWGDCIILAHRLPGKMRDRQIETFYGHLHERLVEVGDVVRRGQKIGTIGTANGRYLAHLHFEVRRRPWMGIRRGYNDDKRWWHEPTTFIRKNRKTSGSVDRKNSEPRTPNTGGTTNKMAQRKIWLLSSEFWVLGSA